MATRTQKVTPEPESVAPEPVQSLGRSAQRERVSKAQRIYADVPGIPRVALPDGSVGAVQRETRADGTPGPLMAAFIRPGTDGRESAQRFSLAPVQSLSDALHAQGVTLIGEPESA